MITRLDRMKKKGHYCLNQFRWPNGTISFSLQFPTALGTAIENVQNEKKIIANRIKGINENRFQIVLKIVLNNKMVIYDRNKLIEIEKKIE